MALLTTPEVWRDFAAPTTATDEFLVVACREADAAIRKELNLFVIEQTSSITDYYNGNGLPTIVLRCTPVQSIASVIEDWSGAWGQGPSAFSGTALTAGIDYALEVDDPVTGWARAGRLIRLNGFWPSQLQRPYGRLSSVQVPTQGTIKVTYTAGLTDSPNKVPVDLQLAANLLISQIRMMRQYGFMTTAEGLAEYHYQLGQLIHRGLQIGTVAAILAKYKEIPV